MRPSDGKRSVIAVSRVTGTSRADEDEDRSRRREVTSATG